MDELLRPKFAVGEMVLCVTDLPLSEETGEIIEVYLADGDTSTGVATGETCICFGFMYRLAQWPPLHFVRERCLRKLPPGKSVDKFIESLKNGVDSSPAREDAGEGIPICSPSLNRTCPPEHF